MKKLLQIESCKNTLSTGKISEDIGKVAIANGWESWKAYSVRFENDKPSASHLISVGSMLDVYCHVLETRIFDNHSFGYASVFATKKLIQKIKEIKPDIIHLHDIKGYWLNLRVLFDYFYTLDIPIIWTLHDCWMLTGHCFHPTFVPCEKYKMHCKNCPRTREYPESYVFDRSFKNFEEKRNAFRSVKNLTLVPVSDWLRTVVNQSFLSDCKMQVIHNGIDVSLFQPIDNIGKLRQKYNITGKHIALGVASTWSKDKGFDDFIRISSSIPETQFVLVGVTTEQKNSLPKCMVGIKRTTDIQEMAALYTLADVFVNPTYADNFPTVNLEALACGTPVITYNTGGSPEAITPETGFVVKQGDVSRLIEKIAHVITAGKGAYSTACRERATNHFDKDKCFKEYIQLYEKESSYN